MLDSSVSGGDLIIEVFEIKFGKMDGKIDYSQWERSNEISKNIVVQKPRSGSTVGVKQRKLPPVMVIGEAHRPSKHLKKRPSTACSSTCQHPWIVRTPTTTTTTTTTDKNLSERRILRIFIKGREKSIEEYKKLKELLKNENARIKDLIVNSEESVHDDVHTMMKKYEKFRGAATILNKQFTEDHSTAMNDLLETRSDVTQSLDSLFTDLRETHVSVDEGNRQLTVLHSYKEREYLMKAQKIGELEQEFQQLLEEQQDEWNDVEDVIAIQKQQQHQQKYQAGIEIKDGATSTALSYVHPSWKEMAQQNYILTKEIYMHKQHISHSNQTNLSLENEIQELLTNPSMDTHSTMFPEIFNNQPICTPDMDVVLDIPQRVLLPI